MSFPEADKTKHIMVQDYIKMLQESYKHIIKVI